MSNLNEEKDVDLRVEERPDYENTVNANTTEAGLLIVDKTEDYLPDMILPRLNSHSASVHRENHFDPIVGEEKFSS